MSSSSSCQEPPARKQRLDSSGTGVVSGTGQGIQIDGSGSPFVSGADLGVVSEQLRTVQGSVIAGVSRLRSVFHERLSGERFLNASHSGCLAEEYSSRLQAFAAGDAAHNEDRVAAYVSEVREHQAAVLARREAVSRNYGMLLEANAAFQRSNTDAAKSEVLALQRENTALTEEQFQAISVAAISQLRVNEFETAASDAYRKQLVAFQDTEVNQFNRALALYNKCAE